jgi:hypothetical protein
VIKGALAGLALLALAGSQTKAPSAYPEGSFQVAAICSKTAEMSNGNGTKTCYYSCSGVGMQTVVANTKICPLTVPAPRGG